LNQDLKKIYFDGRSKSSSRYTGWENYSREIYSDEIHKSIFNHGFVINHPLLVVFTDVLLGLRLFFSKRIAHFPTYPPLIPRRRDCYTIHDLVWISYPQYSSKMGKLYFKFLALRAIKKVGTIIVPSKSIKLELEKLFPEIAHKIEVVNLGKNILIPLEIDSPPAFPYILTIGTLEPRKNIVNLLAAFELAEIDERWRLVVIGRAAWETNPFEHESNRIHYIEHASNSRVAQLYNNAAGYVIPSMYEGFSLTILEATSYKLPILASRIAAHEEFLLSNLVFFNPETVLQIKDGL